MDMETDLGGATDKDDNGENQGINGAENEAADEVVMETRDNIKGEGERVKLSVSHSGLTVGLQVLEKTRLQVRTQAQAHSGGPKKKSEKTLRDVTNKLDPKPTTIAKPTRLNTKGSGSQQIKDPKNLKWPEKAWRKEDPNGLPNKSPYVKPVNNPLFANGSAKGRPPVPPVNLL